MVCACVDSHVDSAITNSPLTTPELEQYLLYILPVEVPSFAQGIPRTIKYKCAIIAHHERKAGEMAIVVHHEKPEKCQFRPFL